MAGKVKIRFLCTRNLCRSQMAEGQSRHLKGDRVQAYSAGIDPRGVGARGRGPEVQTRRRNAASERLRSRRSK